MQNDEVGHGNTCGEGLFKEVSHAIASAQMCRVVCQQQLGFLLVYWKLPVIRKCFCD